MNKNKWILFSAYFCNPFQTSESYAAFKWLQILLKKYQVIVSSHPKNISDIEEYYSGNLPSNLKLLSINDNVPYRGFFHNKQIYLGYLLYNRRLIKHLKKNKELTEMISVIFQKNPSSIRYITSLYKLNKPYILGPLGGGLKTPKFLSDYFKSEQLVKKLRFLDDVLLRLPVYKKQLSKADKVLITLDYLEKTLGKYSNNNLEVFFDTGISVENDLIIREDTGKDIHIIYVGKLFKAKGSELAVKAFHKLNNPNAYFHLIGEGIERDNLELLIERRKIKNIILHGNLPFEEVMKWYEKADIFCYPTLREPSGNCLLEAMKMCLPIITVNNGGPKYMCPDEGSIKVEIDIVDKMIENIASALDKLCNNSELRIQMGRINYNYCKEKYSWSVLEKNIIGMVENYVE